MNAKENWLRLIRNDSPGWIGTPWDAFKGNIFGNAFTLDPISANERGTLTFDTPYHDAWGTTWMMQKGWPAPTPFVTEDNKVIRDLARWREQVRFPALDGLDWSATEAFVATVDRSQFMVMPFLTRGLFERSHYLMGFEDALIAYMEEPALMGELVGAIADWKIGQLERIFEHMHPEVIHFHDDWGTKTSLFLPPDTWREVIKPQHRRIVEFVKSKGALFMHHSDTICAPIVEDMAEIGIDIWQGAIPQDDIVDIQRRLAGRMAIMGGVDAAIIDMPEPDEAVIRAEVRRCIDTYCPQGRFIPCIPNIMPIYPEVKRIYDDEMISYGRDFFIRRRT